MPKTALLIPCYNAERYLASLKKQIDSLDPKFDEVILLDDGSTDHTLEVGKSLGLQIQPTGSNKGPGAARNALVELSHAEWIHFLDADDEIVPDYLARVFPHAEKDTDVVLSGCDFIEIRERKFIRRWIYCNQDFAPNALAATISNPVFLHCSLIRRTKALEAGGFDEVHRCYEDGDFHVRLAAVGARFRCIPDILAFSLRHNEGSGSNELYCAKCRLEFLREYRKYLGRIPAEVLTSALVECGAKLKAEGDNAASKEAFAIAFELGWKNIKTQNPLAKIMAAIPLRSLRRWLFLAQYKARTFPRQKAC